MTPLYYETTEVDRLQAELGEANHKLSMQSESLNFKDGLRQGKVERDTLRAAIEAAPHELGWAKCVDYCDYTSTGGNRPDYRFKDEIDCNCWKAKVLK